jgi:hypothetical protein
MAAPVADDHASHVDRKETAAIEQIGRPENEQTARQDQQRIQTFSQIQAAQQPGQNTSASKTKTQPETRLRQQQQRNAAGTGLLGMEQQFDHHRDEQDGHRIVGAGLDFQRALDPFIEPHPAVAQQREHRCRIGRADDGGEQQAKSPIHAEKPGGENAQQTDSTQHPPGRQHGGRFQRNAKALGTRTQAAIEQDHRQCQLADQVGGEEIVEQNAARTILAGQHADDEKKQQQWQAKARRNGAGQNADEQQQARQQEKCADRGHGTNLSQQQDSPHLLRSTVVLFKK